MKVDEKRLQEIAARVAAATPGPWEPCTVEDHCSAVTANGAVLSVAVTPGTVHANARTRADGEFMANARQDVPDLLEDLREARAERLAAIEGAKQSAVQYLRTDVALLRAQAALVTIADHDGSGLGEDDARTRYTDEWTQAMAFDANQRLARTALGRCPDCNLAAPAHMAGCTEQTRASGR